MPTVRTSDALLSYDLTGEAGDPTVLVHGSWVDRHSWDRLAPLLAASMRVVRYDRRGHGESTGARRAHPVRDDATDLAAVLEASDLFPAHVIAHSYGGAVAFRLALDRPELIRGLVVHEPPFLGLVEAPPELRVRAAGIREEIRALQARVRAGARAEAARAFVERFGAGPGGWDRLPPVVRDGFVRYADRWAEELDDPAALGPTPAELAAIDLPILTTHGSESDPLFGAIDAALEARMRNVTARSLPGAGHVPAITHPELYAGVVGAFLLERDVPST